MEVNRNIDNLIKYWCEKWNIEIPIIRIDNETKETAYHEIGENNESIIGINTNSVKPHMLKTLILHEIRHHYQFINYTEMYTWWANNDKIYKMFYNSPLCVIEEDANIFAWTDGEKNGDILLESFDLVRMKNVFFYKSKSKEYEKEIKKIEIKNNIDNWKIYKKSKLGKDKWNPDFIIKK